jgi:hypothetical protein
MPTGRFGQLITFASELDPDENYTKYVWVRARPHDTIKKIAARRGHPDMASEILKLNKGRKILPVVKVHGKISKHQPGVRSIKQRLRANAAVRLPGTLKPGTSLSVTAGENRPKVTGGYAKYDIVDVPGRVGLNRFDGYDPLVISVPVQFEGYAVGDGQLIETQIRNLERMAGRGHFHGAAFGPPAVIRVSVTDSHGNVVPLIPANYQWSPKNPHAPLYRITGIDWDDGSLSDTTGHRVRQGATITITQYTPLIVKERSAARRGRERHANKGKGGQSG